MFIDFARSVPNKKESVIHLSGVNYWSMLRKNIILFFKQMKRSISNWGNHLQINNKEMFNNHAMANEDCKYRVPIHNPCF